MVLRGTVFVCGFFRGARCTFFVAVIYLIRGGLDVFLLFVAALPFPVLALKFWVLKDGLGFYKIAFRNVWLLVCFGEAFWDLCLLYEFYAGLVVL